MLVNNFKQTSSESKPAGDDRIYATIDMKSFFASVECVERKLNPLTTNLVVADPTRTDKTICLAVSPSLKSYGVSGRARLFEVVQKVKEINARRKFYAPKKQLTGESADDTALKENPALALDYVTAPPRMALYGKYSRLIYETYLEFISPEDIHVYSIDEVFIDLTPYLKVSRQTPHQLTSKLIRAVLAKTGITATAGIGPNLYLAKIAMDIVAKKFPLTGTAFASPGLPRRNTGKSCGPTGQSLISGRWARATRNALPPTIFTPWEILPAALKAGQRTTTTKPSSTGSSG